LPEQEQEINFGTYPDDERIQKSERRSRKELKINCNEIPAFFNGRFYLKETSKIQSHSPMCHPHLYNYCFQFLLSDKIFFFFNLL